MPLKKSYACDPKVIAGNIREMMHAGHPQDQSIAAAHRAAGCPKPGEKKKPTGGMK